MALRTSQLAVLNQSVSDPLPSTRRLPARADEWIASADRTLLEASAARLGLYTAALEALPRSSLFSSHVNRRSTSTQSQMAVTVATQTLFMANGTSSIESLPSWRLESVAEGEDLWSKL